MIVRCPLLNDLTMFAVCDGHGGSEASKWLEERLASEMFKIKNPMDPENLKEMFYRMVCFHYFFPLL